MTLKGGNVMKAPRDCLVQCLLFTDEETDEMRKMNLLTQVTQLYITELLVESSLFC